MNPKLKDYSDRELLELIISNQVNLAQRLFRMNAFFLQHYGKDYIEKIKHKEPTFTKLMSENDDLIRQIRAAKDKE